MKKSRPKGPSLIAVSALACSIALFGSPARAPAAPDDRPAGWAVYAAGGGVYRCAVGGKPEKLYDGDATHACWSADGRSIFFIEKSGQIWHMANDGSNARRIAKGKNLNRCPIAAYRPDPGCVLYLEGNRFYRIRAADGERTLIHEDRRDYAGEIAISRDGKRLAARSGDGLYKIEVGGRTSKYADRCSSSISPNGRWLTRNLNGHQEMVLFKWEGGVYKKLKARGLKWDNQRFAVNSDDFIVFRCDKKKAVGLVHVPSGKCATLGTIRAEHPDFFVGPLPAAD